MGLFDKITGFFQSSEDVLLGDIESSNNTDSEQEVEALHKLARQLSSDLTSLPRNLLYGASTQQAFTSVSRDTEYIKRHELYQDPFTREMIKIIITRAIGAEHNNTVPFTLALADDSEIKSKPAKELLQEELKHIVKIVKGSLFELCMDSQFYGDGYTAIKGEKGRGIEKLIYNFSTKPFNVTPYVSNFSENKIFEVSPNEALLGKKATHQITDMGRRYVSPYRVARLNAQSNGIMELQTTSALQLHKMNAFNDEETIYEDIVYGGVAEGCHDSFENFKWAINSLANMRISSSVIERWIIQNLEATSENERKLLKQALETKIKATRDKLKEKVDTKDPTANIITHTIPTTTDGTNGVQIQESNIQFNQQIDDIMIHIKRYLADIGFNIELTPYSDSQRGGGEREGTEQSSLQMETQGEQIRGAIHEYIQHIVSVHFFLKYGKKINLDMIEINFISTINKAKIDAETQRMEAINNTQQTTGLLAELRDAEFEDSEENRKMLTIILDDVVIKTAQDRDQTIETMVNHILTKKEEPQGETDV